MRNAEVWMWGTRIGYLELSSDDIARFEYDRSFLQSNIEVAPLTMPLSQAVYSFPQLPANTFKGLPGMIADSLPDRFGNAVIDNWLAMHGRSPDSFNVVERLCYIGSRGMGVLEYRPQLAKSYKEKVDIDSLVKLASDILKNRNEMSIDANRDDAVNQLFQIGSSAGGARAKAVIAWNRKTREIRSGQIETGEDFEYYLIKFDGVSSNGDHELSDAMGYTNVEYAYYLMAKDAKINMMPCELLAENGRNHFLTKRFDRVSGSKLHAQTFGALCHIDYNTPRLSSYETLSLSARKIGIDRRQHEELFRRMVFNVLAFNNDDHVKNFTFLMDKKGKWSLSPAYDLSFSYNPRNYWLKEHQMLINGKSKEITNDDLIQSGIIMGLSKNKCSDILSDISSITANWPYYADQAGVPKQMTDYIASILKTKQ